MRAPISAIILAVVVMLVSGIVISCAGGGYVCVYNELGIEVIDVNPIESAHMVKIISDQEDKSYGEMVLHEDYIYSASGSDGLRIIEK
jgi:hypothetical protein